MDDPNVTYKAAFRALAEKLGRVPGPGDSEWLVITNNYSRSWAPAVEEPSPRRRPEPEGFSREPAPQARSICDVTRAREGQPAEEPLSGSRIITDRVEAESSPEPVASPSRDSHGPILGSRGPAGGVMAQCRQCGEMWERKRAVGRPAVVCEECR